MSTYTARSREVTARPRSQRLREVGANGVQTVSSGGDGSSQPRTWEKDVLTVDGTEEAVIRPVSTPLVSVLRFTDGTHIVTISLDQNGYLHIDSGLWSDGFVSALGQGTGGSGGGGGIDEDELWAILAGSSSARVILSQYLPALTKAAVEAVLTGNITSHTHSQYLTAITKAMVEAVLTGGITSHSHAFANITSKPTTLAGYGITDAVQNETVAAGDCNNMTPSYVGLKSYKVINGAALANAPFGQTGFMMIAGNWSGYQMQLAMSVTSQRMYYRYCASGTWSAWSAVAQTSDITFGNLLSKPTTVGGYGITDAMTKNGLQTNADFNELTVPGCYKTNHSTWTDALHVPAGAYHWGTLLVLCNDNDPESRVCQMYMPHQPQGYGIWTRTRNSGSWTAWSAIPTTDGNIASATKLQTARTLWGFSFDGSAGTDGWIKTKNSTGWVNETYGGGWYMSDSTWIRTYGSKSIYHNAGILRTDGTLQVGGNGAYFQANSSGIYCGVVVHATSGIYSDTYVSALGQNSSDMRLKRNVHTLEYASEILGRLRFVRFQWNETARLLSPALDTDGTRYGLIAQEAEEAGIDGLVYDMPGTEYKGVRYDKLIPLMGATIQEQQTKIGKLEQRIARLEALVERLIKER